MDDEIANAVGKWVELADLVMERIEPIANPTGARKKELPQAVMADIKMFGDIGNVIKLKGIMQ